MTKSSTKNKNKRSGIYNVEKILSKRERNGIVEYYVKWENFGR
jgi:hypothetical protein